MMLRTATGSWGPGMWALALSTWLTSFVLPSPAVTGRPNDLDSYHISLKRVDSLLFFGIQVGKSQ